MDGTLALHSRLTDVTLFCKTCSIPLFPPVTPNIDSAKDTFFLYANPHYIQLALAITIELYHNIENIALGCLRRRGVDEYGM